MINFYNAGTAHFKWKYRLKSILDGRADIADSDTISHKDCELGKWLYSEGITKYGDTVKVKELEKIHLEFHAIVNKVLAMKKAGKAEAAEAEYKKIEPISKSLVSTLATLGAIIG